MSIADVLHRAADEFLWDGIAPVMSQDYSCAALYLATGPGWTYEYRVALAGLRNMGVDVGSYGEFDEFPEGPERQAARYMWLKFAALIAEEQGV